jgi:hypothetical protein
MVSLSLLKWNWEPVIICIIRSKCVMMRVLCLELIMNMTFNLTVSLHCLLDFLAYSIMLRNQCAVYWICV